MGYALAGKFGNENPFVLTCTFVATGTSSTDAPPPPPHAESPTPHATNAPNTIRRARRTG